LPRSRITSAPAKMRRSKIPLSVIRPDMGNGGHLRSEWQDANNLSRPKKTQKGNRKGRQSKKRDKSVRTITNTYSVTAHPRQNIMPAKSRPLTVAHTRRAHIPSGALTRKSNSSDVPKRRSTGDRLGSGVPPISHSLSRPGEFKNCDRDRRRRREI